LHNLVSHPRICEKRPANLPLDFDSIANVTCPFKPVLAMVKSAFGRPVGLTFWEPQSSLCAVYLR
jgi:hypothetical protein